MAKLAKIRKERKQEAALRDERQGFQEALHRINELEAHVSAIRRLKSSRRSYEIVPRKKSNTSEATVIACASDWHIGQDVRAEAVNGLNTFNLAIAKERAKTFFERVVRLTNKERQDIEINDLVLFLGGDFIEGSLHLDTIMGSGVSGAMNQVVEAQALIRSGLKYLREQGNFKKIIVVCADGNHGRVSVKQHHHSRRGNSLEYYLYYNLANEFTDMDWVIDESMLTYVKIYDFMVRFMHGDRISFGGVNGFYTYLHRRIYEWDTSRRADYTILGHLHQYTPNRRYLVNGSLVGYNPFAISLGAKYEPPTQAFMLMDKKRGATVQIPILL